MGTEIVVISALSQSGLEIDVVIPVFNGVRYLEEQIESIANQTFPPTRLILRDDGSTDGSLDLIFNLQKRYGDWLLVLPAGVNLGCIGNINCLLSATSAPYVALADQDDVWIKDKLERSLDLLRSLESSYGAESPILVHSDLELINASGLRLGTTYFQRQHLHPRRVAPEELVLSNVVTGCTLLCNRSLLRQALPIPKPALMHDWWLALVASVFGRLELLEGVTVRYRQHDSNVLGSQGLGAQYWWRRFLFFLQAPSAGGHTRAALLQAKCFEVRYGRSLSRLPALMALPRRQRWLPLFTLFGQKQMSKHGPLRTLALWVLLLFLPAGAE